ncbi:MAG: TonB-dependent receptor [Vicinamibacteria bacterium]
MIPSTLAKGRPAPLGVHRSLVAILCAVTAAVLLAPASLARAQNGRDTGDDKGDESRQLTRLSLEELANIKVVSVSKREEGNLETPGSVNVITSEDIRRTGSISIPDALRTSPGLQAAKIDADEWALAIRGFSSRLSRSVLAVVDGRSIWTPLFAGIFWDSQDVMLEDVEQIEVSRGPGGAVYGANAMNGVINITTKSAKDTQGGLLALGLGTADREAALRYGGKFGTDVNYRVFGKYALRDGTKPITPAGYDDAWKLGLGGFRMDWERDPANAITLIGNLYDGSSIQPTTLASFTAPFARVVAGEARFTGQNILGRWKRALAGHGEITSQAYFDHSKRVEPYYGEGRNTVDLDIQHHFDWGGRNDFVWGANFRRSDGTFNGSQVIRLDPARRADDVAGVFANNEMRVLDDRLRLTAGTKLEWNDYSGWNAQPSARVAYVLPHHTFWGSLTRAVRTSSRIERDIVLYSPLSATEPIFAKTTGSDAFQPESVVALETGYKLRFSRVILTASAFRNRYFEIANNVPGTPFTEGGGDEPIRTVTPISILNGGDGHSTGFEAKAIFSPSAKFRLDGSYSYLKVTREGATAATFRQNTPRNQFWLTSYFTPVPKLDVDLVFRVLGAIPNAGQRVGAYADTDLRVGYRPSERVEVSVTGTNLLHASHPEFGGGFVVERAVRVQTTVHF